MPNVRNKIEIPGRKTLRGWLIAIGLICGLFAFATLSNGDGEAFLFWIVPTAALLFGASKVKVYKYLQSYGGVYK